MKYPLLLIGFSLLLSACSSQQPSAMGGMNHQQMGHGMMRQDATVDAGGTSTLLSDKDIDLSTLPEAQPSQVMEIRDGDTIDLNPQIVKKTTVNPENGEPSAAFAMYSYNGQFPGPLLRVKQGSTFTVRVKNEIDQPTTVHWHGIRLDNAFDGAAGVTQKEIKPGESFTYTVTVPDEGMFWYHPHVREDMQQDLGLYGGLWVTPKVAGSYASVHEEIPVFLDDMLLAKNGLPLSYGKDDADHALMGRFGNAYVINGIVKQRFDMLPVWDVQKGSVMRFALVNAANTRTFRIEFQNITEDRTTRMKLVSGDSGRFAREQFVDHVILAPSERAIVDVLFEQPGEYHLLHTAPDAAPVALAALSVGPSAAAPVLSTTFGTLQTHEDVASSMPALQPFLIKAPDETIHLSVQQAMMGEMGMGGMMDHGGTADGIEWEDTMPMMNAVATKANTQWKLIDEASKKENMDIAYRFKVGDKVKIRIINDANSAHPMQHPIHFHGQRFLVLSVDGKPNQNLVWKDTVLVPKGQTVDILLDVTNPGDWMIHCHIAEHLTNGMMAMFHVK